MTPLPSEMKEVIVHGTNPITTSINTVPVPEPGPDQVLIKVVVSGTNPKDWKIPLLLANRDSSFGGINSGDDIAGTVVAVGSSTSGFKVGDRVAAFHQMMTPGGSFAEYALAPYYSTFHIPSGTRFEEAATIPLAAMTAAVALFVRLELPEPWSTAPRPSGGLLVYGAASAVGAFAVQLARASKIHPVICVAGNGIPYVETLLDKDKGDTVVDYRQGPEYVVQKIRDAVPQGQGLRYALDCVSLSDQKSFQNIFQVLTPSSTEAAKLTTVLPMDATNRQNTPKGVTISHTQVGDVHSDPATRLFGTAWFRLLGQGLADQTFTPHPYELVPGGLRGVEKGLRNLQEGKASAIKYVYRIGEEEKESGRGGPKL